MIRQFIFATAITAFIGGLLAGCESTRDGNESRYGSDNTGTGYSYPYHDGQYTQDDENEGD